MKILTEGHQEKALCPKCDGLKTVTFLYKLYLTEYGDAIPSVLQGFCDGCGERLLIPPQSIPKIKPYYQTMNKTQEYKVPNVIEDVLLNIGSQVKMEKPDVFKSILRYYLENNVSKGWIKKIGAKNLGPSVARLSFRIDEPTDFLLKQMTKSLELNKNQFVSRMLWDAKDRLLNETREAKEFRDCIKLMKVPEISTHT